MAVTKQLEIVLLPGDGAGPEIAREVRRVLDKIQAIRQNIAFNITEKPFGGSAIALGGEALSESTLQTCQRADAVILCGCGNAKYGLEPERALLRLRSELGVYVNFRPIKFPSTQLYHQSPFKLSAIKGTDITFVRDLTSGVYYGKRQEADTANGIAYDTTYYSRETIQRIARWAGSYATQSSPPKTVYSVDKYNVMATSRLWRSTVSDIFEKEFPNVPLNHLLVDHAAMLLSSAPAQLNGVILTENLFGDILSDQAGAIVGSQDVLASAGLANPTRQHVAGRPGIFEPVNLKTGALAGLGKVNPLGVIQSIVIMLDTAFGLVGEAESLESAIRKTLDPRELIGSDTRTADIGGDSSTAAFTDRLLENFDFFLEAQNSAELDATTSCMQVPLPNDALANTGRRPMGMVEKILTHSGIGLSKDEVKPGDIICVRVDWTITNELLWAGMEKTYNQIKRPRLHRNDRFWLALDHVVDPRTNHLPKQKDLISKAELFQKEAKVIDFLPVNTSIMHTDFTRERAQPGHIIVGSDSHTCSAGSMGAFAVGMGAADVVMPMVTGETWFRVPEICKIHFVGKLPFGMGGKEVILHILGAIKRNTIAFQRAVEFTGPGLAELSMDARFAIANMTTEFGGVGACFEADEITAGWISKRNAPQHKSRGIYFKPDPNAVYAETRLIDLSKVRSTIALYPNPDDVVPVAEKEGMRLDGCFIGACTTTEEDLIVGALVLEAGFRKGLSPVPHGKRRVTPGSLIIISKLREHGFLEVYERAGFEVGAPGCSYCVGINDVDVAGESEVWLSSQNRNFQNRMGKGSFGNITSAAAVAASSFGMRVADPRDLLEKIDKRKYKKLVKNWKNNIVAMPKVMEPNPRLKADFTSLIVLGLEQTETAYLDSNKVPRIIKSRVQRFADNIDTDAIIPAQFMPGVDNADLGSHCFEFYRPEFREKAVNGSRVIVAKHGFGSGSSREDAVRALLGAGIEAVIAEGFAFIYGRNQLNMALFNIVFQDSEFYKHAVEDSLITIDKDRKTMSIEGVDKNFEYQMSEIEETLLGGGGVMTLYKKYEKALFRQLVAPKKRRKESASCAVNAAKLSNCDSGSKEIEW